MIVQIEVNTRCNYRCWFCQNARFDHPDHSVMTMNDFVRILEKLRLRHKEKLPVITFAAYNEPTSDPHFKDRLLIMRDMGFTYWWISNGSLMTEDLVAFLIRERPKISSMQLNVCSCDPLTLARSVAISEAAAGRYLASLRTALERLSELDFGICINVHGSGDAEHLERVSEMRRWVMPHPVDVRKAGLMNRAGMVAGVGKTVRHAKGAWLMCGVSYLSNLYIGSDGGAYLCCHDYFQESRYGNVIHDDIGALLSGDERRERRRFLSEKFCSRCEFALNVKESPLRAARLTVRPYVRMLPASIRGPLAGSFRAVRHLIQRCYLS